MNKWRRQEEWFSGAVLMTVGAMISLLGGSCLLTPGSARAFGGVVTIIGVAMFVVDLARVLGSRRR